MAKYRPVRKAVFPVAGLGTRFLPATKAIPKEMLTVVDKPVIQYVFEEARAAGIEHFVFVTGRNKAVIEDHFDVHVELQRTLEERGRAKALETLAEALPEPGRTSFTRQQEPKGLGHAVWCARDIVGDEPFALLLPDMIMQHETPCLKAMADLYDRVGGNVLSTEAVAWEETQNYGIVEKGEEHEGGFAITAMVEKPAKGAAPSNLMISGRYILQPEIFGILSRQKAGAGGEIQLTDAMVELSASQPFYGYTFTGRTFDCGSREGFIKANVAYAMADKRMAAQLRPELETLIREIRPK